MSKFAPLLSFLSGWPRRTAALAFLVLAGLSLASAKHPTAGSQQVVVTARDLAAGASIKATDVRQIGWPDSAPPSAAARTPAQVIGRRTATALARGTPIGDGALMEPALGRALAAGQVATTVRLNSSDELALVRAGNYVDLYATDSDSGALIEGKSIEPETRAMSRASQVEVLSVLPGNPVSLGNANPTLVIAVDKSTAAKLSAHAAATFVATLVEPP